MKLDGISNAYIFSADVNGACVGITSNVYIPTNASSIENVTTISTTFQSIVESELREIFASLPAWVSEDCHFALRKLFCSSRFLHPQHYRLDDLIAITGYDKSSYLAYLHESYNMSMSTGSKLLNGTSYAPAFPQRSVCDDYTTKCGAFASVMLRTRNVSTFLINCNEATSTSSTSFFYDLFDIESSSHSVAKFPTGDQVVRRIPLKLFSTAENITWLNISTSPNYLSDATNFVPGVTTAFRTKCPSGFVVPDDRSHPRNHWIEGTGCAEACRFVYAVTAELSYV
jgi:hypothetical protein